MSLLAAIPSSKEFLSGGIIAGNGLPQFYSSRKREGWGNRVFVTIRTFVKRASALLQHVPNASQGLASTGFVFYQRKADVGVSVLAETYAWTYGYLGVGQ